MHPMFVKLFIETDADDLPSEEDWRRRARRSRRARPAMAVRPAPVAGSIAAAVTGDPPAVAIRDSGRGAIPDAAGWQPAGLSRAAELLMTVEGRIGPEGAQP